MMGLFGKALKSVASAAIGDKASDLLGQATKGIENATGVDLTPGDGLAPGQQAAGQQALPQGYGQAPASAAPVAAARHEHAWFVALVQEKLPQFQIQENVVIAELFGAQWDGKPYDIVLYEGGAVKGVITLVEHNKDNNKAYKNSRTAAQEAGVPFINFYLQMPNETGFVLNRIKRLTGLF
jgi:hypothetical protein